MTNLHLNVLSTPPPADRPVPAPLGRMKRRRAIIMVGVYILMTAHIVQWRLSGRTVSPIVMSDTMNTLENGELNAGFIFFSLTVLATLLFGRFMCGWVCHMGALQDLCAWLLRKTTGVRARPFRARILGYVPLALALYMFVWPTLKRDLLVPLLRTAWPSALPMFQGVHDFPGFSSKLLTDDMWAHLPPVVVAIPFLLVCGFGTVYFLGARGLCRYGCPYGGLLMPAQRLAPVGIVVDPSLCDRCGKCTAACEAGVRVHEETGAWGMVASAKCIRSLDCVEACPTGALSLGATRPPLFRGRAATAGPKVVYDLTWAEEIWLTGLFLGIFVVIRGLYGLIPMLLDVSIAACATFAAWKMLRLIRERDLRLGTFQLKRAGRLRPAGLTLAALGLLGAVLLLQSAAVKALLWSAGRIDDTVTASREVVMSGRQAEVSAADKAAAERALQRYALAGSIARGGVGLADTPWADVREGWLNAVLGRYDQSEAALARATERGGQTDGLCADLALVTLLAGQPDRAATRLREAVDRHPGTFEQSRDLLLWVYGQAGRMTEAAAVLEQSLRTKPADWTARARLGLLRLQAGDPAQAVTELRRAAEDAPGSAAAPVRHDLAIALFTAGDVDGALSELDRAAAIDPNLAAPMLELARQMRIESGRPDGASGR